MSSIPTIKLNVQVFRVHCSNGFYEFDSHTTTKIINMYEALEHYKVYKQKQKAKQEMDKFLNKLTAKNGTTKY